MTSQHPPLLGRQAVLAEVRDYLARDHNVLLLGPRDVGKSAIIRALALRDVMVLDPFMGVSTRLAGEIRRTMERGVQCIAATRTVDRAEMGAVRRLAFRFTTVRVPPLSAHWIKRLLHAEYAAQHFSAGLVTPTWTDAVVRLAQGRPGLALALVRTAAVLRDVDVRGADAPLPSPSVAYIEASIRRVELRRVIDGVGELDRSRALSR